MKQSKINEIKNFLKLIIDNEDYVVYYTCLLTSLSVLLSNWDTCSCSAKMTKFDREN